MSDDPSDVAFNPRDLSVTARPVEFDLAPLGGAPPPFSIQDDGTFELKNLSGHRLIRVSVRNPGWMLKRVTRDKAKPVSSCSVLIFAADRAKRGEHSRFVDVATTAHNGSFSITGLPPEDYFAIAVPAMNGAPQNLDVLRSLEPSATRFLLGDGEAKTLTLRLLR